MFTAELIKGETYDVKGHIFRRGKEIEVSKEVYDYLVGNIHFELKKPPKVAKKEKE